MPRWYCAAVAVSPDRVIMVSGDSWESMETTVWRIRNALLLKVGQHALGDITSYCIYFSCHYLTLILVTD